MSLDPKDPAVQARIREITDVLEAMAKDRQIMADLPFDDRKRLLAAVTLMFNPSPSVRRNMVKASKRR